MGDSDKAYELYGKLPDPWLVTLRVDRNGIASAKVKEKREDPDSLAVLAEWCRLDKAPRPGGLGLPCSGISLERQGEDGMWRCEWDFDGATDPQSITFGDPSCTTYEIDCSVTTARVETFPRFLPLAEKYGVTAKNYDKSGAFLGFPRTLNDAAAAALGTIPGGAGLAEALKNPLYGTEDYYISQMVYRVSSAAVNLPADFRKNLSKIDKPRAGGPGAPGLEGRANWLKTIARATWRGNIWATAEEWTASGPEGWNEDLYRPQA